MSLLYLISIYAVFFFQVTGILLFAIFHKRSSFEYNLLGIFVLGSFIIQIFNIYNSDYNLYLVPIYGLFEFTIFSILFFKLISPQNKNLFLIIASIISIVLIIEGITSYFNQNAASFFSYGKVLTNLSIITYSAFYIINTLQDKSKKIEPHKINLSFVILAYYVTTLLNYIAINFLVNNSLQIVGYFWQFHAIVNVLFYMALTFLLWKHGKTQNSLR
ncbi:MAG: hypothetical protein C0599_16620 [Salinivirgaceae bacterium]|nr:MAG: hypothetical protein C0599_16620 [Salinivirgaceae bacterium]